jgi:hypothetical protein
MERRGRSPVLMLENPYSIRRKERGEALETLETLIL